ncbi:MAG: DUF3616 domain-containing protein [Fibrella sp.]|nr:DUF3616 domain-containing protein [Armatimonadota bacterium]
MKPSLRHVLLQFDAELSRTEDGKEERGDLSVAVEIADTLWVASDETVRITRLSRQGKDAFGSHVVFDIADYLSLPGKKDAEADLEGLDYADGYLWMTGSHSFKRGKPDADDSVAKNLASLAHVTTDSNRFLLARVPVVEEDGTYTLTAKTKDGGEKRTAALLRGDSKGNDLTDALAEDEHLAPFLTIPSKDNGFDIEGLAVSGNRVFLGLRGPVLRGWAVVLELETKDGDAGELRLKKIGAKDRRYRKHFLDLRGLGIREMCLDGDDLLLLAGPTMALDGPAAVYRWQGGANPPGDEDTVIFEDKISKVLDIPHGIGEDHAEGMTFRRSEGGKQSFLVVYDSPAAARIAKKACFIADAFDL